ncbi:Radical SAM domain protein [Thermodesulfobium narugense DSM 14796]|uniref:Radical SAM domain protein n=1 Tax=Thermodesulfobium narugense DSM 14796 TaxID=747365 RepID=M1E8S1_9BACT|nr:[FeFe] hydrogenase H-cluster radical SAM maturase HydE [Thermodesulfobium narugense]AEE15125.1 Radical SAM domain protein [Thermodesulfobium narugense DSM 14796]
MPLVKKEIIHYLTDKTAEDELFSKADDTRKQYCGDTANLRGVIHFSNYCRCDDLYCGLRKSNKEMKRFRMDTETIISLADEIAKNSIKTIVLQSGEDVFYSCKMLCQIIKEIKRLHDVAITLSLGERSCDDYKRLYEAGADRYLMKHETMNEELYEKMRPGRKLKDRLKALEYLREIGFQVGTGNIVGLPGQTIEDLAKDILFFQDFQPDMINIGPFIPHKQTPLKDYPPGDFDLMLKVFALTRIVTLNTHIAAANTVATLRPIEGQYLCFVKGGCNVLMPNCNPFAESKEKKVEFEFQCAPKKRYVSVDEAKEILKMAGRKIAQDKGHSLKRR